MVVPGHPLQPEYAGSNELLADGAHPVLRVDDVLEVLEKLPRIEGARPPRRDAGPDPRRHGDPRTCVLAALDRSPRAPEAVAFDLGLPLGVVLAALTELELLGLARTCPGQRYALPRRPDETDTKDKKIRRGGAVEGGG
jgi:DNA processing protein